MKEEMLREGEIVNGLADRDVLHERAPSDGLIYFFFLPRTWSIPGVSNIRPGGQNWPKTLLYIVVHVCFCVARLALTQHFKNNIFYVNPSPAT